ncbi:1-acyl-sn-glycerol-3-phosphate acyltransferase [Alteromonas ponticola]|uniref:1-acyl-sn-glycerol-3-phosphate acyltransferase n=1 Tax=Alteromonas aquimaris TaxID=2998417 RepID=A0ABT3P8R9_9ALTE|nr:lysophospholipid acyltransferase family protein [Alteromonas aquimaris]MCW8108915.1 1-acyl-sn-glycerol-3-phosphate acyltransferase [Alteromonas aquimaris]
MKYLSLSKIRQLISAAVCYFLFGLGALSVGIFFRLLHPVPFISSATKRTWIRWCIHKGCHSFIRIMRALGLIRYSFDVKSMIRAKSGHIIIANHPTLIDVVLLLAVNRQMCCFVKGAVWDNFFTGAVVKQAGFIPNHTEQLLPMAAAKLEAGENILIFPEGTRTKHDNVIHFKRGAANMAVAVNAPIMPVLIKCYPGALKKGDKWYDIPDGGPAFELKSGPLLELDECIDTSLPRPKQYRHLTQFLEQYYQDWVAVESPKK